MTTIQSYLLVGQDKTHQEKFLLMLCEKEQIQTIDCHRYFFDLSIGIKDIRILQKEIFLTPVKSPYKVHVLENARLLTPEAQNALLKVLEEPPSQTIIVLVTDNKNALIPTIQSRCTIIVSTEYTEPDKNNDYTLEKLLAATIGEKLMYAQNLTKNKIDTKEWVANMTRNIRAKLLNQIQKDGNDSKQAAPDLLTILIAFQKTYTIFTTTNANQRLALEYLFLTIEASNQRTGNL